MPDRSSEASRAKSSGRAFQPPLTERERRSCAETFTRARPRLLATALRLSGDLDEASDLVQETWLRALENRGRLSADGQIEPWLGLVLRRIFIDRYRSRVRSSCRVDQNWLEEFPAPEADADPESLRFTVDDLARARECLPATLQRPFDLYSEGVSYAEIGRRLGLPSATVGTRLHRAKKRLRVSLQTNEVTALEAGPESTAEIVPISAARRRSTGTSLRRAA